MICGIGRSFRMAFTEAAAHLVPVRRGHRSGGSREPLANECFELLACADGQLRRRLGLVTGGGRLLGDERRQVILHLRKAPRFRARARARSADCCGSWTLTPLSLMRSR